MTVYNAGEIYLEDLSGGTSDQIHIYAQTDNIADGAVTEAKLSQDVASAFDYLANWQEASDVKDSLDIDGIMIDDSGAAVTNSLHTSSRFIPLWKGWRIEYSAMRASSTVNLLSVYSGISESDYVSGIAGIGANSPVDGSYTATDDVYVRLCTRTASLSDCSVTITSPAAVMLDSVALSGTSIRGRLTGSGSILNDGTEGTGSGYVRSGFIYVPAGWIVRYTGIRIAATCNALSWYSSPVASGYVSGAAGAGASSPVSGSFMAPSDGYVRLCDRADNTTSDIIMYAPMPARAKYVAPAGSDDNDGDSAASPYASISKALDSGAPDIYLAPGDYTQSVVMPAASSYSTRIHGYGAVIKAYGGGGGFALRNSNVMVEGLTVDLTGATDQVSCFFMRDSSVLLIDCAAINSTYMGFRLDGSRATLVNCSASGATVDGFNAHDTASNSSEGYFIGCTAADCLDDGLSYHENGVIHVLGGEYHGNSSTGIAPHNNCSCDIRDAYVHNNGRAGIEALVGNYETPDPLPVMVLSGCMFEANTGNAVTAEHYTVKACGNGASGNGTNSIVDSGGSAITTFQQM